MSECSCVYTAVAVGLKHAGPYHSRPHTPHSRQGEPLPCHPQCRERCLSGHRGRSAMTAARRDVPIHSPVDLSCLQHLGYRPQCFGLLKCGRIVWPMYVPALQVLAVSLVSVRETLCLISDSAYIHEESHPERTILYYSTPPAVHRRTPLPALHIFCIWVAPHRTGLSLAIP